MGQKTNPIGNRLGIIRGWESNWYGGNDYGDKLTEDEKILVSKKLGGAATVIVPVFKDIVHSLITGDHNTLGIRIPYHPFCQQLARKFSGPITTTSVNRTGDSPMTDPNHIYSEFKHEVDLLIDDGIISGRGSAIYIYKHGKLKTMRS